MKKREHRQESGNPWINMMCELLKGGVFAGLAAIGVLFVCAVLVSAGVLGERWIKGAVLAACVVGAMLGGLYAVRKVRGRAFLSGLGVGVVLFLLLLTAGLLAYDAASLERGGIGILCACLCGGAIPGILGRGKKNRRR